MQITNELRSRIYGAYRPKTTMSTEFKKELEVVSINAMEVVVVRHPADGSMFGIPIEKCSFPLAPLSDITDEHAIEVAKMAMWHWSSEYNCSDETIADNVEHNEFGIHIDVSARCFEGYVSIHDGCFFVSECDTGLETPVLNQSIIIDYLRQWYDLGFLHIPSLIAAGIAVDKSKI